MSIISQAATGRDVRHLYIYIYICVYLRSFSAKEPYNEWLICGKRPERLAIHPMGLYHPRMAFKLCHKVAILVVTIRSEEVLLSVFSFLVRLRR